MYSQHITQTNVYIYLNLIVAYNDKTTTILPLTHTIVFIPQTMPCILGDKHLSVI